jgi:hypothetical protein
VSGTAPVSGWPKPVSDGGDTPRQVRPSPDAVGALLAIDAEHRRCQDLVLVVATAVLDLDEALALILARERGAPPVGLITMLPIESNSAGPCLSSSTNMYFPLLVRAPNALCSPSDERSGGGAGMGKATVS